MACRAAILAGDGGPSPPTRYAAILAGCGLAAGWAGA